MTVLKNSADMFHDFWQPKKGEPSIFVQWKGTSACADFHCVCGLDAHVCGTEFMYTVRCAKCGRTFAVQSVLHILECAPNPNSILVSDEGDEHAVDALETSTK